MGRMGWVWFSPQGGFGERELGEAWEMGESIRGGKERKERWMMGGFFFFSASLCDLKIRSRV